MNNLTDREKRALEIDKLVNKKLADHISPIDWYSRYDGLMPILEKVNQRTDENIGFALDSFEYLKKVASNENTI